MAEASDSFLSCLRTACAWLLASAVLCPGGILRQPDLPPSRSARSTRRSTAGRQSQPRPTRQAHGDRRSADQQALPGQTANRDRRFASGKPVMRSYYKNGCAKHYVRDHDVLRFEAASNDVKGDYGINKAVKNLVPLREKQQGITERYQNVQQDILETFLNP